MRTRQIASGLPDGGALRDVNKRNGFYPAVGVDAAGSGVVSQAGAIALVETVRAVGLDREALSRARTVALAVGGA